jgi:hypothetical protein
MWERDPAGVAKNLRGAPRWLASSPLRNLPLRIVGATNQRGKLLTTKCLAIAGVCLAAAFVAFIALEAFDGDLDLWPLGSEQVTVATDAPTMAGVQTLQRRTVLTATPHFVMPAGAHLIVQHRARSAITPDCPFLSTPLDMAEPRESYLTTHPRPGHFSYRGPGNDQKASGRSGLTLLGPLPRATGLTSRFSF